VYTQSLNSPWRLSAGGGPSRPPAMGIMSSTSCAYVVRSAGFPSAAAASAPAVGGGSAAAARGAFAAAGTGSDSMYHAATCGHMNTSSHAP